MSKWPFLITVSTAVGSLAAHLPAGRVCRKSSLRSGKLVSTSTSRAADGTYLITMMNLNCEGLNSVQFRRTGRQSAGHVQLVDILDAAVQLAACAGSARETWNVLGT